MNLFFQMALETRKTSSEIRTAEREAKFRNWRGTANKIREDERLSDGGGHRERRGDDRRSGVLNMAGGLKSLKASGDALSGLKSEKLPNRPIEVGRL
ncbi:MAG: hypothetical protein IPI57_12835 [Candidatus Competibacteraceae bacterium]|nr:hypothetical protein [Candidatus Competibacteraceae bacterium]